MSILQDFERIHRELGDEKWQQICGYCEKTGHRLDTVLYTEPGWNAFEAYLQNEDASKGAVPVTVKQLLDICKEQIEAGNGDKTVLISDDDEGNGFHTLFYGFLSDPEKIRVYQGQFHDGNDPDDVVILG